MKAILILLMFLIIGALLIINNNNLALHNPENIERFKELYIEWFNNLYLNSQTITGNIVDMEWLPKE